MPRQSRKKSSTGIYHVMLRGINKQDIFEEEEDYVRMKEILNRLNEVLTGTVPVSQDNEFKDVNFTSPVGNITGETGNLGVTYMPTNGGTGKGPLDGNSVHININPTLSPTGAAEAFSHEGYGHARIYVETNGNRGMATHHYLPGGKDSNQRLVDYSIRARKETIKNMQR